MTVFHIIYAKVTIFIPVLTEQIMYIRAERVIRSHGTGECLRHNIRTDKKMIEIKTTIDIVEKNRDVAQSGSALRSGRRSREFKSPHPDIC